MKELEGMSHQQLKMLLGHLVHNLTVSIRMFCQASENIDLALGRISVLNGFVHWYSGALLRNVSWQEILSILTISLKQMESLDDDDLQIQLELCWREAIKSSQLNS